MAKVHHGLTRPGTSTLPKRWSVPSHVDLREWDGEFVVRCNVSGATYQLSPLAGEALKALQAGVGYPDEIVARIFGHDAGPPNDTTAALMSMFAGPDGDVEAVMAVLTELEALGIARAHVD